MSQPTNNVEEILNDQYILKEIIGEGTFGKVKLAIHILTQEKVAIKILEKKKIVDQDDVNRVNREVQILKRIRHPHIIQLLDLIETDDFIYLIMEYAQNGELFEYIVQNQRLNENETSQFLQQLLSGVEYLHKFHGVVHRDLKPENLLLDYNNNIKIADFGLSNVYQKDELLATACGSPCYAAPEMIAGQKYQGSKVDIWSCGVVLYAMVCGYLPFEDEDTGQLYQKIMLGEYEWPQQILGLSPELTHLMANILNVNPLQRIDVQQIISHDWITKYGNNANEYNKAQEKQLALNQPSILDPDTLSKLAAMNDPSTMTSLQESVLNNRLDHLTCAYYLLLQKRVHKIERFRKSVAMPQTQLKASKSFSGSSQIPVINETNNEVFQDNNPKAHVDEQLNMYEKKESIRMQSDDNENSSFQEKSEKAVKEIEQQKHQENSFQEIEQHKHHENSFYSQSKSSLALRTEQSDDDTYIKNMQEDQELMQQQLKDEEDLKNFREWQKMEQREKQQSSHKKKNDEIDFETYQDTLMGEPSPEKKKKKKKTDRMVQSQVVNMQSTRDPQKSMRNTQKQQQLFTENDQPSTYHQLHHQKKKYNQYNQSLRTQTNEGLFQSVTHNKPKQHQKTYSYEFNNFRTDIENIQMEKEISHIEEKEEENSHIQEQQKETDFNSRVNDFLKRSQKTRADNFASSFKQQNQYQNKYEMQQAQNDVQEQLKNLNVQKIASLTNYMDNIRAKKKQYQIQQSNKVNPITNKTQRQNYSKNVQACKENMAKSSGFKNIPSTIKDKKGQASKLYIIPGIQVYDGPFTFDQLSLKSPLFLIQELIKVSEKLGMWVRQESKFKLSASKENMGLKVEVAIMKHYPQYALVQFYHSQGESSRYMHYSTLINNHLIK